MEIGIPFCMAEVKVPSPGTGILLGKELAEIVLELWEDPMRRLPTHGHLRMTGADWSFGGAWDDAWPWSDEMLGSHDDSEAEVASESVKDDSDVPPFCSLFSALKVTPAFCWLFKVLCTDSPRSAARSPKVLAVVVWNGCGPCTNVAGSRVPLLSNIDVSVPAPGWFWTNNCEIKGTLGPETPANASPLMDNGGWFRRVLEMSAAEEAALEVEILCSCASLPTMTDANDDSKDGSCSRTELGIWMTALSFPWNIIILLVFSMFLVKSEFSCCRADTEVVGVCRLSPLSLSWETPPCASAAMSCEMMAGCWTCCKKLGCWDRWTLEAGFTGWLAFRLTVAGRTVTACWSMHGSSGMTGSISSWITPDDIPRNKENRAMYLETTWMHSGFKQQYNQI